MSMPRAWESMVTDEENLTRTWEDIGPAIAAMQTRSRQTNGAVFSSVMWDRGYLTGARNAVEFILGHQTHQFDRLTTPELIGELRKGPASIYWPIIHTIDPGKNPEITVECPSDLVHNAGSLQPVDREGHCLTCGYDHMT